MIGKQIEAEGVLDVAHHLRLHGVERLVRATGLISNLQVIRAIPDDCRKTSAYVLDLLEAVRVAGVQRRILGKSRHPVLLII